MCVGVIGIERDGLFEQRAGLLDGRGGAGTIRQCTGLQHQIVGLRVHAARRIRVRELHLQRRRDRARDLVLHLEDVGELVVVMVRPQLIAIGRVHQFHDHPHLVALAQGAAGEHALDVQLAGDGGGGLLAVAVLRRGIPRDHAQTGLLAQRVGQFLADAVAEVLLFGIAAEVGERQYHDGAGGRVEHGRRGDDCFPCLGRRGLGRWRGAR